MTGRSPFGNFSRSAVQSPSALCQPSSITNSSHPSSAARFRGPDHVLLVDTGLETSPGVADHRNFPICDASRKEDLVLPAMEGPAHSAESFRGVSGGEGGGGEAFARMQMNGAVELIDAAVDAGRVVRVLLHGDFPVAGPENGGEVDLSGGLRSSSVVQRDQRDMEPDPKAPSGFQS